MIKRWLGRMGGAGRATAPPFELATEQDLFYCYRLLLRREPDAAGWGYWQKQISKGLISLPSLTSAFLSCDEFMRTQLHTGYAELQLAAQQLRVVELDQFQLYVPAGDAIGETIASQRTYEPHVTRLIRELLGPGAVFLDVGSNVGYFSLLGAALVGPQGRIIAFEPNPRNCVLLRSSMRLNGFEQIELHAKAVAAAEDVFVLEVIGSNGRILAGPERGAGQPGADAALPSCYVVHSVALDQALADLPRLDLVKIDVEGAEPGAVQGMASLLRRYRPPLISEFFPSMLRSTSSVEPVAYLSALRELGYALHVIAPDGERGAPLADEQILEALSRSGCDHIDLLALPSQGSGLKT